jgi:hypothetical protein
MSRASLRIAEINKKTDLYIALESLERSKHRRMKAVIFAIKGQGCRRLTESFDVPFGGASTQLLALALQAMSTWPRTRSSSRTAKAVRTDTFCFLRVLVYLRTSCLLKKLGTFRFDRCEKKIRRWYRIIKRLVLLL